MSEKIDLDQMALDYHRYPTPGKIAVMPTKAVANQRDLSLAYSPGVAAACRAIVANPAEADSLTARANLVAVITNGTAVLGLGDIGPLAAKPVMEGKAVLFKKFAGIDVFDIEIAERDPDKLVEVIAALEPSFGGINLEDIKAPECFVVEQKLRQRMKIPVFHDDQHGTAITVGAAVLNALRVVGKNIGAVKLVCSGAGAAAISCLNLLVRLGLDPAKVWVIDKDGVLHDGRRAALSPEQARFCRACPPSTGLKDAIRDADVFLGLSAGGVLKREMVATMVARPVILALANPQPEIMPDEVKAVRPEAVIATGRSDFPNQVNNVLCFPFIFRGALDVGATIINEEMELAAVRAIADLATAETSDVVARAYGGQELTFGPEYLIPKPFDPRLIMEIAPRVAEAAMKSGVATRPIVDFDAYREKLSQFVYKSGMVMKPLFERAREEKMRVIYADGEDIRVLQAVQVVLDEELATPILIGRPKVIEYRLERHGLRFKLGQDVAVVDPEFDPRFKTYWTTYHQLMERKGISPADARRVVRTRPSVIAALSVKLGHADALITGVIGNFKMRLDAVVDILGLEPGMVAPATMELLILPSGTLCIADSHVNSDPDPEQIAAIALAASQMFERFGVPTKVALLSHSAFGTADTPSARKMRDALGILQARAPQLEVEGEMMADLAINVEARERVFPNSRLRGRANLMIMPNLDSANIAYSLLKELAGGQTVGPILLGVNGAAHVVIETITVRGLVNMTAVAATDAIVRVRRRRSEEMGIPSQGDEQLR